MMCSKGYQKILHPIKQKQITDEIKVSGQKTEKKIKNVKK